LATGESRRLTGRYSRKVDERRKPKVGTKAKPEDRYAAQVADRFERRPLNPAADGSRRLGSKAGLEGWQTAKVEG